MPRRSNRILTTAARANSMDAAAVMRRACIRVTTEAPTRSPAFFAADRVLGALADLAAVLEGDRSHLEDPQHSAGLTRRPDGP